MTDERISCFRVGVSSVFDPWLSRFFRVSFFRALSSDDRARRSWFSSLPFFCPYFFLSLILQALDATQRNRITRFSISFVSLRLCVMPFHHLPGARCQITSRARSFSPGFCPFRRR